MRSEGSALRAAADHEGRAALVTRRHVLQLLAGGLTGLAGLGGYAFAMEPGFRLVTKRYRVHAPGWPETAPDLTVAVIADIHAVEPFMPAARIAQICEAANALRPDLIVVLGDFEASHRFRTGSVGPDEWSASLARLGAPLGVYAILGN